ncbi:MAG: hypothetical protein JWN04_1748 [Myxococcaceae bacterium]|nr:hypothetical protein [Myxococcaceae bacterium]
MSAPSPPRSARWRFVFAGTAEGARWPLPSWVVAALLAVYVALGIHSQVSHLADKPLPQFLMEDYSYYAAGYARWLAGQSPYADHVIGTAFLYPPQSLLLVGAFEALGTLPLKFAVYATLSLLALLGVVILVLQSCRVPLSDPRSWIALVLAFSFGPVGWCLYLGQINLFVALTVAAGFFLEEKRPYAAGAAIAVGAALKLTPILLIVLFLHRRYWRVHTSFVVTSIVLALVTGALFGFHQFVDYLKVGQALKNSFPVGINGSLSFINTLFLGAGVLDLPTQGWFGSLQLLYTGLLGLTLLLSAWLTRDGQHRHLFYAIAALALTVMPNVLWYHHLVFVLAGLLTLLISPESSQLLRYGAAFALGLIQLDRLLSPALDKFTTTPVCLALLALTFVVLARVSPGFLPSPHRARLLALRE